MSVDIQFSNNYKLDIKPISPHFTELINNVIITEKLDCKSVSIIWVTDEHLRKMHEDYLDDPELTDVMTFNLGDDQIEAEIYISVDRAIDQSKQFSVTLDNELNRLLVHGLLHLSGYDDHTDQDIKAMREREAYYLDQ